MNNVPKNTLTFTLLFLLLLSTMATNVPAALAKPANKTAESAAKSTQDKKAVIQDWLVVPVFYATNRVSLGTSDVESYSEQTNPKGLVFGVRNFAVPLPFNTPIDEATQMKMGWQRIHALKKKHAEAPEFDSTKCVVKDKVLSRSEIVPAFEGYRDSTGNPENIIYVHGCCAGFDTVMRRAAMVASHTQAPVLAYDWVSPKGFQKYLVNETMIDQTLDDFCKFMNKVETIMDPKTMTLIGHSMGAELVDQAMVRRAQLMKINPTMPKFKEVIMSNADVDVLSFLKHGNDFVSNAEKTRIYFSTNDKRLRLSTFVHGGFLRLGAPGSSIAELVKLKGADCIDITANNTGHDLPYWLVANMHKYNNVGPVKGFELKEKAPGYLLLERSAGAPQQISEEISKCVCGPISFAVTK